MFDLCRHRHCKEGLFPAYLTTMDLFLHLQNDSNNSAFPFPPGYVASLPLEVRRRHWAGDIVDFRRLEGGTSTAFLVEHMCARNFFKCLLSKHMCYFLQFLRFALSEVFEKIWVKTQGQGKEMHMYFSKLVKSWKITSFDSICWSDYPITC